LQKIEIIQPLGFFGCKMFYSTSLELVKLLADSVSVQGTHGTQGVLARAVKLGSPPSEISFETSDFFYFSHNVLKVFFVIVRGANSDLRL